MYSLSDFDYHLPPEKIAHAPVNPRDSSKLLIVNRDDGALSDAHFSDLADLLTPNDVLVLNNTKVFPARLLVQTTKPVELLLEKEVGVSAETISWDALTKPGLSVGDRFEIPGTPVHGVCEAVNGYTRKITFFIDREHFFPMLDKWAKTPIPPYIKWEGKDEQDLREQYQTIYAKRSGAVAAPTAGLHFTPELLEKLKAKGVQIEEVTLHVGLGTFLPVKTDDLSEHHMHSEWFELSQPTAENLNDAKKAGKRIIAVGTTTVRVLETCSDLTSSLSPLASTTDIFIYPPYQFKFVDSILTNFHTPKSTLLMLISSFVSVPNTNQEFETFEKCLVGKAYLHALAHDYRFYSFGDSMWIQ
jgi:S-adenosylmethionine:tRNA ribosyltransferase-isomerase